MIKKVKKVKRINDEAKLQKTEEDSKLQDAIVRSTIPLDIDPTEKIEENILFNGLEGRLLLVQVGKNGEQVDNYRLEEIEKQLSELIAKFKINCLLYVTQSDVDIKVIG